MSIKRAVVLFLFSALTTAATARAREPLLLSVSELDQIDAGRVRRYEALALTFGTMHAQGPVALVRSDTLTVVQADQVLTPTASSQLMTTLARSRTAAGVSLTPR